ncbi:hypothetical protein [Stackebrandtia soli]|uniref:hypothetical protein n=1 Tax=Stackebrandtia soli TaxID=1892856 RepID=UPI0039EC6A8A
MALPAASFVIAGSLLMVLVTEAGRPEWIISLVALGGGLAVVALTIVLVRLGGRGLSPQEDE